MDLYATRPVRQSDLGYLQLVWTDPAMRWYMDPGLLGDHARWWIRLQLKHQRWPWWKRDHPPIPEFVTWQIRPVHEALGWTLVLLILWKTVKH